MARAAEVYAKTGNYADAARAVGVERNTIRDALRRQGIARKRTLHARACEAGLRKGRAALADMIARAHRMLASSELEPRDFAALMNATSKASETIVTVAGREDSRQASKLTREKTRVEIARLRAGDDAETGDIHVTVNVAPQPTTGPAKGPEASGM